MLPMSLFATVTTEITKLAGLLPTGDLQMQGDVGLSLVPQQEDSILRPM